ncbi:TPA: DUF2812 domain-containing protein, partial [Listeria monocytogenes]|nr:DUF2812 domain-containing protein [Listeria monocytogenes]
EAIFTDETSLIQLYKNIRKRWTIFGAIVSLFLLIELLIVFQMENNIGITTFIFIIFLILVALYGKMFFNLTRKINHLVTRKTI